MMYDTHHILHRITLTHTLNYSIIFEISLSLSPPHSFFFHFHLSPSSLLPPVLISPSPPAPPPPPSLLHLGLTAHTHSLTDYTQIFGGLDKFFIDHQTQISPSKCSPGSGIGMSIQMNTEERELILALLNQMTRSVMC